MKTKFYLFLLVLIFTPFLVFAADETLTITTYYPSPYGSYNQFKVASNTWLAYSSGSVGIGTTGPQDTLHVYTGASGTTPHANTQFTVEGSSIGGISILGNSGAIYFGDDSSSNISGRIEYTHSSDVMNFVTNDLDRMRIDGNGNVGIGTTPKTWDSWYNPMQIGAGGFLFGHDTSPASAGFGSNVYISSGYKRVGTGQAVLIDTEGGTFSFWTAPSGAADSAISWTNAMAITNAGNVGIGTADTTTGGFANKAVVKQSGDANWRGLAIEGNASGGHVLSIDYVGSNTFGLYTSYRAAPAAYSDIAFGPGGSEKVRFTTGGNVGIGTASPGLKLDVYNDWLGSSGGSNSPTGGFRFGRWPAEVGNTWVYLSRADSTAYQDLAIGALWAGGSLRFGTADDLAEMTPVNPEDNLEPGDAVIIDTQSDRVRLTKSKKAYDTKIAGIISDVSTAGLIIGGSHPSDVKRNDIKPLAISGRVLAKVSAENGSIQAGDFLTTSANPGYLMRCDDRTKCGGAIAGKAMEHLNQKKGKIWVLVALQ